MSALGRLLNIKLNYSTVFHPEMDGQTERTNQTIETFLRTYTNYQQDDWADLLPIAKFAYNNSPHSATQVSPFFANYGYNPRATLALDVARVDPATHDFSQSLSELHRYCKEQVAVAQRQYQGPADRRRLEAPEFKEGDMVWLSAKNISTKLSRPGPETPRFTMIESLFLDGRGAGLALRCHCHLADTATTSPDTICYRNGSV